MLTRRTFATWLTGTIAAPEFVWGQERRGNRRIALFSGVGRDFTRYEVDVAGALLVKRDTVELLSNVQYAWPHPSRRFLYVSSSNGGPGQAGSEHHLTAFRFDHSDGALRLHGEPITLRSRPIHNSVDRAGEYLLVAYNEPSALSVHRIRADGSIGEEMRQPNSLDCGIYAHQIRASPSNRSIILVTRGDDASASAPERPGSLKVFSFRDGMLNNKAAVQPGNGIGFGPRHLEFHPTQPWVYVSVERQNKLYAYELLSDGGVSAMPLFVKDTMPNASTRVSIAGPIHVHPNGKFIYLTNRGGWPHASSPSGEIYKGEPVYQSTDSNVAVFSINQSNGEPTLIQTVDAHGAHPRTFAVDPSGRILVAGSLGPIALREGGRVRVLAAGLSVFRIDADGRLGYLRRYDVETGEGTQWWTGLVEFS